MRYCADLFLFLPTIGDNERLFMGNTVQQYEITIDGSEKTFIVKEGESILIAALRQGVMLPYSCKNGTCGSCKGVILSGEVHYPFHPPLALERSDIAAGYALLCQAAPMENLAIKVREIEAVRDIEVRMLPARVIEKTVLAESACNSWPGNMWTYCFLAANAAPSPSPAALRWKMRLNSIFATWKAVVSRALYLTR